MRLKKFDLRILLVAVLGIIAAAFFIACDADYDDPSEGKVSASSYYANDATESPLVSQAQLKVWIDNGYKTEDGKRVVIIDATAGLGHSNYIPGAIQPPMLGDSATLGGQGWGMTRTDGPLTAVGNEVFDGPTMDEILQWSGIDINTVIVLTHNVTAGTPPSTWASGIPHQATRPYWVFYYWGFSKANLKLLDGGNPGFAAEFGGMQSRAAAPMYRSTFSVKDLPSNRIDLLRAPYGEVYGRAVNGDFERGDAIIMNTMGRGVTYSGDGAGTSSGNGFNGKIRGAKLLATAPGATTVPAGSLGKDTGNGYFIFKNATDAPVLFADFNGDGSSILPADKNTRIIVHCGSGQSTTPYWFYLTFILGYTNVAVYDGSTGEWNTATTNRYDGTAPTPTYVFPGATTTWVEWDPARGVWADAGGTAVSNIVETNAFRWDAAKASDYVSFQINPDISLVDLSYDGNARDINEEDKAYRNKGGRGDDAFSGGGAVGGGC